ncbi:MAG: hypothetical protein FWD34_06050 [Oscillospiraceae bacterium]|nr:hypothetical protein [Oscillospiraceae bacterium]
MIINANSLTFPAFNSQINQNTQTTHDSGIANLRQAVALDKRFDSFITQVSENFVEKLNEKIEAKLMNVMSMSAEDRRYFASMNKENMKRLTREAIEHEEKELERFKDLREQKEYYQGILDKNGYVERGKFAFSGTNKTQVSTSEVQKLLDSVQEKIDDIVTAKVRKESDPLDFRTFEYLYSGAVFLAATGMKSLGEAMLNDNSLSGQWTRTEENYIQEAERSINSLNQRSKNIDKMYNAFKCDDGFEKRVSQETLDDKIKHTKATMDIFNKWSKRAVNMLSELNSINQDELITSFEKVISH